MSDVPQTIEALLEQICRPDVESLEGQLHIDIKGYAKAQLKSLFETMLDGTLYVTLPKGVDKTCMKLLIEEQKKRSEKVISKYFGGGE